MDRLSVTQAIQPNTNDGQLPACLQWGHAGGTLECRTAPLCTRCFAGQTGKMHLSRPGICWIWRASDSGGCTLRGYS